MVSNEYLRLLFQSILSENDFIVVMNKCKALLYDNIFYELLMSFSMNNLLNGAPSLNLFLLSPRKIFPIT